MKFHLLAVGHKMPDWVNKAFAEYTIRMPRETPVRLVEIKPASRGPGMPVEKMLEVERDRITQALPADVHTVILDERGAAWTTLELASHLKSWLPAGRDVAFVIGGADGLHPHIKAKAQDLLQLSAMTLPHGLVRVLLAEQLYRASSILQGHPYHRE